MVKVLNGMTDTLGNVEFIMLSDTQFGLLLCTIKTLNGVDFSLLFSF